MKSLLVLNENIKHLLALILVTMLLANPQNAQAAWSDQHVGQGLTVHYVQLAGYGGIGNQEAKHKTLLTRHKGCTELLTAVGKPTKPLPAEGIPDLLDDLRMEIYSSANRVLVMTEDHLHTISMDDCALKAIPHRFFKLYSAAGKCEVDLLKKEAIGQCNTQMHERAPASLMTASRTGPTNIDLSKLPPQVRAQLERVQQLQQKQNPSPAATGAHKNIAGYPCRVYRSDLARVEVCVATPTGAAASRLPIPSSPFNADIPGLLLETTSPWMTLQAEKMQMNLPVSQTLFAIPQGVKINPRGGQ